MVRAVISVRAVLDDGEAEKERERGRGGILSPWKNFKTRSPVLSAKINVCIRKTRGGGGSIIADDVLKGRRRARTAIHSSRQFTVARNTRQSAERVLSRATDRLGDICHQSRLQQA